MKKKKVIICLLLALCGAAVIVLAGIHFQAKKEAKPENTILAFARAFNDCDVNGMLDCMDEASSEKVKDLFTKEGDNYRLDAAAWFALTRIGIKTLPALMGNFHSGENLPKLELEVKQCTMQSETTATAVVDGTISMGESYYSFTKEVALCMENDRWVICGVHSPADSGETESL